MRDRPNTITRNPKKQIIELSKLSRGNPRISTPTNGSIGDEGHDVIKRRRLCVGYTSCCTKGTPKAETTKLGVMTYSSPLIQLFTN